MTCIDKEMNMFSTEYVLYEWVCIQIHTHKLL